MKIKTDEGTFDVDVEAEEVGTAGETPNMNWLRSQLEEYAFREGIKILTSDSKTDILAKIKEEEDAE